MNSDIKCNNCGHVFVICDVLGGQDIVCPNCHAIIYNPVYSKAEAVANASGESQAVCIKCGHTLLPEALFCVNCGSKNPPCDNRIKVVKEVKNEQSNSNVPKYDKEIEQKTTIETQINISKHHDISCYICSKCGTKLLPNSMFCVNCGSKNGKDNNDSKKDDNLGIKSLLSVYNILLQNKKVILCMAGILIIFLCIIINSSDKSHEIYSNGRQQSLIEYRQHSNNADKIAILDVLNSIHQVQLLIVSALQAAERNDSVSLQNISYKINYLKTADISKCPEDFQRKTRDYIFNLQKAIEEICVLFQGLDRIKNSYADQYTKSRQYRDFLTSWAIKNQSFVNNDNSFQALLDCAEQHGVNVSNFR
ncbi:MAG: zinc ribbon domain-containing protein [Victivallales bacterium]|nr:zinc ribbon domain-containing protein [Victivallales bacterium]